MRGTGRALTGRVAITARMLGSGLLLPGLAQHHAANNTDSKDVQPTMRKIEQMRVCKGRNCVFHDNNCADPSGPPGGVEQKIVRDPRGQQYCCSG